MESLLSYSKYVGFKVRSIRMNPICRRVYRDRSRSEARVWYSTTRPRKYRNWYVIHKLTGCP